MQNRNPASALPLVVILGLVLLGVGCSETSTSLAPDSASFAKPDHAGGGGGGGGSSSPSTVQVRVDWDDDLVVEVGGQPVAAGIIGDGRAIDGGVGTSAYQDGVCGVNAKIYTDSNYSGEMVFDTYTADECGDKRVHYFYSGLSGTEPLEVATKTIARELWSMEPGQETTYWEGFHFGLPQCDRVVYGAEYETEDLKRTRLDDGTGARQWRVESQGTHRARCVYWAKGKDRHGAFTEPMPFAFTVTEVLP